MPTLKKPEKQRKRIIKKEERLKIYQSAEWLKLRQAKLMLQPLCEMCLANGIVTPAEDVHHIDSFMNYVGTARLAKAFDFSNLMSICKECHAKVHHHKYLFNRSKG